MNGTNRIRNAASETYAGIYFAYITFHALKRAACYTSENIVPVLTLPERESGMTLLGIKLV